MAIIDNTLQVPQYNAAAPLQQAAQIQNAQAEAQAAQFKQKQNEVGAEMRGVAPFVNSPEFPQRWAQAADNLLKRGVIDPNTHQQIVNSPSPLMLKSIISKTEDPALSFRKDEAVREQGNQDRSFGLQKTNADRTYSLAVRAADRADEGPVETATQRAAAASKFGIDPQSTEGKTFILTGKLPDATPKTIDIKRPGALGDTVTETMVNTPQGPRPLQMPQVTPQPIPQAPQPGQPAPAAAEKPQAAAQPADLWSLQGPEFLAALNQQDPKVAKIVKAIADHEVDPNKLSIVGGHRERLIAAAKQYDPEYDAALAPARFASIKEFNSGGPNSPAATIVSGGTTIGHLLHASDASQKLGGTSNFGPLNSVINKARAGYEAQANDPNFKEYNTTIGRIAEEGTKFYRGVGGTESDIQRDIETMAPGQSQESRDRALATQAALIYSKVAALQDRYKQAMGTKAWEKVAKDNNFPVISDKNREAVNVILKRGGLHELPPKQDSQTSSTDPLGIR